MKRTVLLTVGIITMLAVAAPMASAQTAISSHKHKTDLGALTASWWDWAMQDPTDPEPYDTACAEPLTDDTIDPPSNFYATVDGKNAKQVRIASGVFEWT